MVNHHYRANKADVLLFISSVQRLGYVGRTFSFRGSFLFFKRSDRLIDKNRANPLCLTLGLDPRKLLTVSASLWTQWSSQRWDSLIPLFICWCLFSLFFLPSVQIIECLNCSSLSLLQLHYYLSLFTVLSPPLLSLSCLIPDFFDSVVRNAPNTSSPSRQ